LPQGEKEKKKLKVKYVPGSDGPKDRWQKKTNPKLKFQAGTGVLQKNIISPSMFYLNRVRNAGNDDNDISSEKHFTNSKTKRSTYSFITRTVNFCPTN
jgi:hypothetical protein